MAFVLWHTTNDHYLHVVNTSRSFPHSWLITGFVIRVTWRVPLVEQELLTLPEHLISPPFLVGFVLLGFCSMCMFCRSLIVPLFFFFLPLYCLSFFDLRILITSLWYLHTLLANCCSLLIRTYYKRIIFASKVHETFIYIPFLR